MAQPTAHGYHERPLVLGSGSPRRAELIRMLGLTFTVLVPDVDERPADDEPPAALASRLSETKADAVLRARPDAVVIAADTVVSVGAPAVILGKPDDRADAERMLSLLEGRVHLVHTGFTVACVEGDVRATRVVETRVTFKAMTPEEIREYVASGEPMDKAGAYGLQGLGGVFVRSIEGSYSNVIGLPLAELHDELKVHGFWPPR